MQSPELLIKTAIRGTELRDGCSPDHLQWK